MAVWTAASDMYVNEVEPLWSNVKAALLEDLDSKKRIVDQLLENMQDSLVATNKPASTESFEKVMLPMIRRIIPGTIAQDIVGVQPLSEPQGLVYSLRFKYEEEKEEKLDESLIDKLEGWARAGKFGLHRPSVKVGKSLRPWSGRDSNGGDREVPQLAAEKPRAA